MAGIFNISGMAKRWEDANRIVDVELVRLSLRSDQCKALVGPSGCGKSTLLDMIALALTPDSLSSYDLQMDGSAEDISSLVMSSAQEPLARLRARKFGYVIQTGALLPFLSVRENIELPQRLAGRRAGKKLDAMLEKLGIAETLAAYPSQLSVGQRQRVAVARALSHSPDVVLLDEPTAALDPATAEEVLGACLEFANDIGAGMLIVTHDHALADHFSIPKLPIETGSDGRRWWTRFDDVDGST
jgi:putative ABC transport system ATP-binding protein